jgi:hypothetical protein
MYATGRSHAGPAFPNATSRQRSRRLGCISISSSAAGGSPANRRREWDRFWGIVEEKLTRPEAELALQEAGEIAQIAPSCLLCYEADWQVCHRRRVAEILCRRHGFAVRHLAVRAEMS